MDTQKIQFQYSGKTSIGETKPFKKKGLASYSVNLGNICAFGCTYCYVPSITIKQKVVQNIIAQGHKTEDISYYRPRDNVLACVSKDLKKIHSDDNGTVFFCTTCDPCATPDHADTTIRTIRLIMDGSNLQVRVLSKSALISHVAQNLSDYRDRVTYSLSTGTALQAISQTIEERASNITQRVAALHWLQENNFRTYGMICPVLPSEVDNVNPLLDQVRPERCEGVWIEAVNVREKSLVNTYDKLMAAGLEDHAIELQRVMGNKKAWIEYTKKLFLGFQGEMNRRGLLDRMHFLQYVSKHDRDFFEGQPGATCL
jgi:DNA repair photolyase